MTKDAPGDDARRQQLRVEALRLGGHELVARVNAVSLEMAEKIVAHYKREIKGYAKRMTSETLSTLAAMRARLKARKERRGS